MARTKVCGLTREADVDAAVDAGADAVGFVVDVPVDTPREVDAARAVDLVERVPPFVTTVLVTMPSAPQRAVDLVERVQPDVVQCHGDLSAGDVAYLASRVDAHVLKAVDAADVEAAQRYVDVVDALLVDSADADGGGGTGETHDWTRTREAVADLDAPVVLAGGLNPENVADALDAVEPFGVDVASSVEARGGVKDHERMRAFLDAVAAADAGGNQNRSENGDENDGDDERVVSA
ncbi:phosphoribosylanthranilate isomerase [Halorubellus sp. JP-L1]|uniref:phosphoribosylanthranilate isomerase n=1 Tax=Halorubellus sp. JP-L1 TaxID=2715753 RepID=UPI0014082933|nr:phosphoribosylanthranilate isomerase [Halorubellus sp. JP-L1]NHN41382.1 phosphoribosylanthranilate isomerase [Halorubellus sp. JP-L1]